MRTALIMEDTPAGLKVKLVWQVNGFQDHLSDAISMHLMAQFTESMRQMEKAGALRLMKESESGALQKHPE